MHTHTHTYIYINTHIYIHEREDETLSEQNQNSIREVISVLNQTEQKCINQCETAIWSYLVIFLIY